MSGAVTHHWGEKDLEPALPSACNTLSPQTPGSPLPSFQLQLRCHLISQAFPGLLANLEPTPAPPLLLFCFVVSMASTCIGCGACSPCDLSPALVLPQCQLHGTRATCSAQG